ncbi:hypothetical protein NMY22_g17823 [Coprinellus aureogranulatus]|nr:hypothetical protein NMY22_g17823 [Coprinellus aureogranulatus]
MSLSASQSRTWQEFGDDTRGYETKSVNSVIADPIQRSAARGSNSVENIVGGTRGTGDRLHSVLCPSLMVIYKDQGPIKVQRWESAVVEVTELIVYPAFMGRDEVTTVFVH